MGLRDSERWEYIRQPRVAALIVVAVLVLTAAVFTAVRRVQEMNRVANLGTYDACREHIEDETLCRYAEAAEESSERGQIITQTESGGGTPQTTTIEVENPNRVKSVTYEGPREIEAYVFIDAVTYVKDYSDGVWASYEDRAFMPAAKTPIYNFSSAGSSDVVDFRDRYHPLGTETCGSLTCYKYQINNPEDSSEKRFIWFDNKDYLLRQETLEINGVKTQYSYDYRDVAVAAPSPVKTVTEQELEALLE